MIWMWRLRNLDGKLIRFFEGGGLLFSLRELWSIWIGGSRKAEQRLDKRLGFLNETDEFFWQRPS